MTPTDSIVERIHHGRSSVVLGGVPEIPETIVVVRVRADLEGPQSPLERATRRIERILEGERAARHAPLADDARSLRARFVDACNRLAAQAPGHAVLVLDHVDAAPPETHAFLAQLLREPAKLRLALLLVVRQEPPASFREVIDALATPGEARAASRDEDALTMRVLRAASVCGASFRASDVARLLSLDEDTVLLALQHARDAGHAIVDRGDGQFALPPKLAMILQASVLPSLRARWLERLGAKTVPPVSKHATPLHDDSLDESLETITRLVRSGDITHAADALKRTIDAIAKLPPSAHTHALTARAMLERARMRWLGAGVDSAFTLDGALEAAFAARAALGASPPPKLRADVASMIAGIAYDLGDGASIERAASVLVDAIAALLAEGATLDAAMLLNDQAALELRVGRGERARDLAARSLALLDARLADAPTDAAARADRAATLHLLARFPLHGATDDRARAEDAIAVALRHIADAEAEYRALDLHRDVGRTIETRARLEAARGDNDSARIAFETALRIADSCGDLSGLARVTAGLAELLVTAGKTRDALGLLATSIELNRAKGSPIGLAFDEQALLRIEDSAGAQGSADRELAADLARTRTRLERALALDSVVSNP